MDMAMKFQLHVSTFAKNLASDLEEMNSKTSHNMEIREKTFCNKFILNEEEYIGEICREEQGYLEATLKLIDDKNIDEIIEYSVNFP